MQPLFHIHVRSTDVGRMHLCERSIDSAGNALLSTRLVSKHDGN